MSGNTKQKRFRLPMILLAVLVCLLGGTGYLLFRPLSPDAICRSAVAALEARDARTLVALADPAELAELNMTEAKVQGALTDVFGKQGFEGPYQIERDERPEPDIAQYAVKARATPFRDSSALYLVMLDHPKKGWRLNLSGLLHLICKKADPEGSIALQRKMNIKYQFWGIRSNEGGYLFNRLHPKMPGQRIAEQWN